MNAPAPANPLRNFFRFFFAIGIALAGLATYFIVDSLSFLDKASHADGMVVARREGQHSESWSIVRFRSRSGAEFRFQSNVPNRSWERFPVGSQVDVLYDAGDPLNARINSFTDLWGLAVVFGMMGLVCLALGFLAWLQVARASRRPGDAEHNS